MYLNSLPHFHVDLQEPVGNTRLIYETNDDYIVCIYIYIYLFIYLYIYIYIYIL